jgi:hypothetical protein
VSSPPLLLSPAARFPGWWGVHSGRLFGSGRSNFGMGTGDNMALECARVGSLERVMHQPEGGPQAVFRYRRAPRYPTGDIPASGDFKNSAACYRFATFVRSVAPGRAGRGAPTVR